jgi:hypothetical protein
VQSDIEIVDARPVEEAALGVSLSPLSIWSEQRRVEVGEPVARVVIDLQFAWSVIRQIDADGVHTVVLNVN